MSPPYQNFKPTVIFSLVLSPVLSTGQLIIDPDVTGSTEPLDEVTFDDNGTLVTQTSSQPNNVNNKRSTPVTITSLKLASGDILDVFNLDGAAITLGNLDDPSSSSITGIGVLQSDGTRVELNGPGGPSAFKTAAENALQSSNINEYIYYDGSGPNSPGSLAKNTTDYRINFRFSFEPRDYLLVQERNGNTYFQLTPLDINGNAIAGANTLQFAQGTAAPFSGYSWNSGFANDSYQSNQEYAFSVASVEKFFEGTSVTPQPVYGFAIDNDGNADVKFFGASDDTFRNNPANLALPGPTPIPEPTSSFLIIGLVMARSFSRRRGRA